MAKRKGKIAPETTQAVGVSQPPFSWVDYPDKSGHMVTDRGHSLFEYDLATDEVRNGLTGRYGFIDKFSDLSWREQCEKTYMETLRPEELLAEKMKGNKIWYPTYPTVAASKDGCEDVYIADGVLLSMADFNRIHDQMVWQAHKHYKEDVSEHDTAYCIANNLREADDRGIGCRFDYYGRDFQIPVSSFVQVPEEKFGMFHLEEKAKTVDHEDTGMEM